jgi:RNA 2',3'-cyclic 3'-phosphodiesterase
MPRLFVAVDLPETHKRRLSGLQTDIPSARWSRPQQMHLTLRFIGADVPAEQVEPIKTALRSIHAGGFDLELRGVGRFPLGSRKAPRGLWVGIQPQPALNDLHHQVESALAGIGIAPDDRPFSPHITLARLKAHKLSPQAEAFLAAQADFRAEPFTVTEFLLISSTLTPGGSKYTYEERYFLG